MSKKAKPLLKLEAVHDVHGLLDFMLVEACVEAKSVARDFIIPYKNILPAKEKYKDAELVVEISVYWDANRSEDDDETSGQTNSGPTGPSTPQTRH